MNLKVNFILKTKKAPGINRGKTNHTFSICWEFPNGFESNSQLKRLNKDTKNDFMSVEEKDTRGGKRIGSGAKLKYGEETTTLSIKVPKSKKHEILVMIRKQLEAYQVKD